MNLNERAAKVMNGKVPYGFDPQHDYNHAHLLYERVVEKGLEDALELKLLDRAYSENWIITGLNLTAAQLTEACCDVLENNDEQA